MHSQEIETSSIKTNTLLGDALNWSVHYAHFLATNGSHPISDEDKLAAMVHMQGAATFPDLADDFYHGMQFVAQERIGTYEKNGKWYGVHSDDISGCLYDSEGYRAHGIIYPEDVVEGSTMLEAGLRSYVFQVVGESIDLPKELAVQNELEHEEMANSEVDSTRFRMCVR